MIALGCLVLGSIDPEDDPFFLQLQREHPS
jgi:hypothetical protein